MNRSTRTQRLCAPLVCVVLLVPAVAVANCSLIAGNATVTPDSRFSDNGNGTITDLGTALMWTKAPIASGPYTQLQAEAQADASTVGSHVDRRLPTRSELGSINETGCSNPALNTTFFTLGTASAIRACWNLS